MVVDCLCFRKFKSANLTGEGIDLLVGELSGELAISISIDVGDPGFPGELLTVVMLDDLTKL